jgi:hypothetical protein
MKTSPMIWLALAGLPLAACSQGLAARDTPALVKNTLKARFPYAREVEWEKKQDLFEAEFIQGQQEHEVWIDATGTILLIRQDIAAAELPAAVARTLERKYGTYTVEEPARIEKNGRLYYQVDLEKGFREQSRRFGADGREAAVPVGED